MKKRWQTLEKHLGLSQGKNEMSDKIALFDMDNTLFDYSGALKRDLQELMSPGETFSIDDSNPWIKNRIRLIKRTPGWWRSLPMYNPGWEIYREVKRLSFNIQILTKGPFDLPTSWSEKVDCIQDLCGNDVGINIVNANKPGIGIDKAGTYGHVLVDDFGPYVLGWLEHRPRGLVIMPAHDYNEDVTHPNIIRYDGTNIKEVRNALVAVKRRESNQHWKDEK